MHMQKLEIRYEFLITEAVYNSAALSDREFLECSIYVIICLQV